MCWQLWCPQDRVTLRWHLSCLQSQNSPSGVACGQANSFTWVPWDLRSTGCGAMSHRCALSWCWYLYTNWGDGHTRSSQGRSHCLMPLSHPECKWPNPATNTLWWHQFCCFLRSRVTSVCQCCCCGREHNTGQCHCLQVSFLPLWHWQGTKTQNQGVSNKVKFCFLSTWNVVTAQLEGRSLPGLVPDSECHEGKGQEFVSAQPAPSAEGLPDACHSTSLPMCKVCKQAVVFLSPNQGCI